MGELEQELSVVFEGYKASIGAKDVDAFLALYDENVRVFDVWGEWSYEGAEAWRGMVTEWFSSLGSERVVVEIGDVRTTVAGGVAIVHAFVTYRAVSAEGDELRAMENRLTWGLQQRDEAWKIVHEHTSAPIDFETSKVILAR